MNRYFVLGSADHARAQRLGNRFRFRVHLQLFVDAPHVPGHGGAADTGLRGRRLQIMAVHQQTQEAGFVRGQLAIGFFRRAKVAEQLDNPPGHRRRHGRAAADGLLQALADLPLVLDNSYPNHLESGGVSKSLDPPGAFVTIHLDGVRQGNARVRPTGTRKAIVVPRSAAEAMLASPPSVLALACIFSRPWPAPFSHAGRPLPLSLTRSASQSPSREKSISACVQSEWRTTLFTASLNTRKISRRMSALSFRS